MNLRDKNSKFFFNSIKNRQYRNENLSIHDDNGTCITDAKEVNDIIVNYFKNLFF